MKKMYLLAAVLLLLATNAVSYWAGSYNKDLQSGKDYEAACLQADFIRYIIDEFGDDVFEEQEYITQNYGEIFVDYAILPDYDAMLARCNDLEVAQAETQNGM